jgi:hypothetical protein
MGNTSNAAKQAISPKTINLLINEILLKVMGDSHRLKVNRCRAPGRRSSGYRSIMTRM